jgi:hypothetical protein
MWAKRGATPPYQQKKKKPQRGKYPETGMKKPQLQNSWRKPLVGFGAGMMLAGTDGGSL